VGCSIGEMGVRGSSSSCLTDAGVARSRPASSSFIAFCFEGPLTLLQSEKPPLQGAAAGLEVLGTIIRERERGRDRERELPTHANLAPGVGDSCRSCS
jgi:hypothetical protein